MLQSLDILHGYFEYLSPKNELKDLHSAKQRVFSEEIADGKITAKLEKAKRIQIPVFHGTDLRIRDRVRSIMKAKLDSEKIRRIKKSYFQVINYYNFYITFLRFCFCSFYKG